MFKIFRFPILFIEIPPSWIPFFWKRLEKPMVFGPNKSLFCWCPHRSQHIDPNLLKQIPKFHFMFCNGYWYHISKIPFMCFDRYWSHIQDFQDFIRRFFGIVRCPPFPKLIQMEIQSFCDLKEYFVEAVWGFSCIFWSVCVIEKNVRGDILWTFWEFNT